MDKFLFAWSIVMIIDNLLPFLLAKYYKGYDHKRMALSVLGCKQSPVKWYYNIWCIISGLVFIKGGYVFCSFFANGISVAICVLMVLYGIGCEIFRAFSFERGSGESRHFIKNTWDRIGFGLYSPLVLSVTDIDSLI